PNERPVDEPLGCRPDGYHLDYGRWGVGKRGRAVKIMHQDEYISAGPVPALQRVSLAAWIYVFKAGDANFILSKGGWDEAYSLSLDHGRLRFNIGDRFVRSTLPVPAGHWVHVAGTFDGSLLRAYIDGEEVMPRARYLAGGAEAGVIWRTRNADGPLDEQYAWADPLPPTSAITMKGREVTFATRLIGAEATISGDAMRFTLKPGAQVYLVTPVLSDLDAPDHLRAAKARAAALAPDDLAKLNAAHREWWTRFWSESYVDIGDPEIERFYYSSEYMIASSSRAGKVAPGLYGNWVTTDHPSWNGDYTLNYNHETPYLALYASNHLEVAGSFEQPVLDMMGRAKQYARTILGVRGVLYPGHIGPWGMERPFDYDPFMGQKHIASFLAQNMLMRFYSSYDLAYARRVYPFLLEVGNFWEDYLTYEGGHYVVHDDCIGEIGPWKTYPTWDTCAEGTRNTLDELTFLRSTFQGLIDISTELGTGAERREKWQHILDHLSPYPTAERDGKTVFRAAENSPPGRGPNLRFVWPTGQVGLGSDPKLLQIARDTLFPRGYSQHPMAPPALARLGFDPKAMLEGMRKQVESAGYPNGYIFFAGGGVETASPIPGAVNEMLLQSYQGVLRLFPDWPKDRHARFGQLRAYGAFLVSSELTGGEIQSVLVESEKGRPCTLQNPWPGRRLTLVRNGGKPERLSGDKITFQTRAGERIAIRPD
ncbi:MAG TPA: LamG-like jellyroll fold domain-containing protein, partial [Bryobacteraceae bacterium]